MKFEVKNKELQELLKFQEGGEVTPPAAPAPEELQAGGSPEEQILMACQQAVETQDCSIALQVCQVILESMGGGAPAAPQAPEGQEPVYRKGGKLSRWTSK